MKNKFKVGDIVKGKHNNGYGITNGNMIEGRVTGVFGEMINVKPLKFKVCSDGLGHEFRVRANGFELVKPIKEEAIVIYRKGDKVYALDKQTGEKASAKCHREDEFDFKKGAEIAFNRLLGKEPVKPQGYKVGDKVKVRSDLKLHKRYYCRDGVTQDSFVEGMDKFAGKIVTITEVTSNGKYRIEGSNMNWVDGMFESGVIEKHPSGFEIGDTVRLKNSYYDIPKGAIGEVVQHEFDGTMFIDFKVKYSICHTGNHKLPEATGLWLHRFYIEKV